MKTSKRNKLLGLALVGSFGLFSASNVFAAAGTTISNTATLSYEVGGSQQTDIDASTDFVEDRVINFTVTAQGTEAEPVGPEATDQVVGFTLVNLGNSTQDFLLRAEDSTAADPFPPGGPNTFLPDTFRAYRDVAPLGVYDPNDELVRTVTNLPPTVSTTIWLVADMPVAGALNQGDISTVSLVVRAARASTGAGFLIPDGSGGSIVEPDGTGEAIDAFIQDNNGNFDLSGDFQVASGGLDTVPAGDAGSDKADDPALVETVFLTGSAEASDINSFAMQIAALTVTKTSDVIYDDINGGVNVAGSNPKAIPGSVIRYTVQVDNATGAGDATLTIVTDDPPLALDTQFGSGDATNAPLPAALGNNVRITDGANAVTYCTADANAADGCTFISPTLTVDLGTAAGTPVLSADDALTIEYDVILPQ